MHELLSQQPAKLIKTRDIEVVERAEDGGVITINTPAIDRDQDRVLSAGAKLENYAKNPVVQYGHNYREPWATVGRTLRMEQTAEFLKARFKLRPAANEYDPQNIVRLLWTGDWIRTASVGFAPVWNKTEENEFGGLDFGEWDLLEWSLVPVPANQEALRLAFKGLDDAVRVVDETAQQLRDGKVAITPNMASMVPALVLVNKLTGTVSYYEYMPGDTTTAKTVIPFKSHALADRGAAWDGPAQMRAAGIDDLRVICTWYDGDNPDVKLSYKLPHHLADGYATVWRGVAAAMGALLGARGGVNIPDGDKRGVYNHLARHYAEFDEEPPEFRHYDEGELKHLFPEVYAGKAPGAEPDDDSQDTEPAPAQGDTDSNQGALPSDEPPAADNEPNTDEPVPGSTTADDELTPEQEGEVADALLELIAALS